MMPHRIKSVKVHLVSLPVAAGLGDSTRKLESVGYTIVRLTTDDGLEGLGITYHEVGGEAIASFVRYALAPRLIGRDPLETEVEAVMRRGHSAAPERRPKPDASVPPGAGGREGSWRIEHRAPSSG